MAGKTKTRNRLAPIEMTHREPTMLSLSGKNAALIKNAKIGQTVKMVVTGKVTRMQKGPFDPELNGSIEISSMRKIGGKKKA